MIFEAPILKANETTPESELRKKDGMKVNVPVFDRPGAPQDQRKLIGAVTELFYKEDALWAKFEIFGFEITVGYMESGFDIQEIGIIGEPAIPKIRDIDYTKD